MKGHCAVFGTVARWFLPIQANLNPADLARGLGERV